MSDRAFASFVTLVCALILAAPAVLNQAPFFYYDTAGYLKQAEWGYSGTMERVMAALSPGSGSTSLTPTGSVPAADLDGVGGPNPDLVMMTGRSVYYGLLAYFSYVAADLWPLVALQCLMVAWLIVTLFRHSLAGGWALPSILTIVALSVLTPAAFFAGLVMPDIWSGTLILAVALWVAHGARLSFWSRGALFAVLTVSVLSHTTHLLLLTSMLALGALAWLMNKQFRQIATIGSATVMSLSIACGVAGSLAYSIVVERTLGQPPISRPHLSAHLVDLGPGTTYLKQSCPDSGLALCAFVDRLPVSWIAFLFDYDQDTGVFGIAAPEVQRALAEEDVEFALRTVRSDPVTTLGGLAFDGVSQLWHLSIEDVPMVEARDEFLAENFTPDLVAMARDARLYSRAGLVSVLTVLTYASTAVSVALLVVNLKQRRGMPASVGATDNRLMILIAICLVGVLLNALICGVLASPYGRFQARLVWILPLLAALTSTVRLAKAVSQPMPQRSRVT